MFKVGKLLAAIMGSQTQQTKPPPSVASLSKPSRPDIAKTTEAVVDVEESLEKIGEKEIIVKEDSGHEDVKDNAGGGDDKDSLETEIVEKDDSGHGSDQSRKNSD